jgi:hypothetical protein
MSNKLKLWISSDNTVDNFNTYGNNISKEYDDAKKTYLHEYNDIYESYKSELSKEQTINNIKCVHHLINGISKTPSNGHITGINLLNKTIVIEYDEKKIHVNFENLCIGGKNNAKDTISGCDLDEKYYDGDVEKQTKKFKPTNLIKKIKSKNKTKKSNQK